VSSAPEKLRSSPPRRGALSRDDVTEEIDLPRKATVRNVIQIQTVAGPVQATSDVLAAALAELVDAEYRATEADLLDAVLVSLDDESDGDARVVAA
jgi:hypothetical protein